METSIVKSTLTDGSATYSVVFVEGSSRAILECATFKDASRLQDAFAEYALYAVVA